MNPNNLEYVILSQDSLDMIAPLWEKLRNHHAKRASDFRESFSEMTWAERKKKLTTGGKKLKLILAQSGSGRMLGYCIASIDRDAAGEIDSIYIEPDGRGLGIGRTFMERSLSWFDAEQVSEISIDVAVGNEEALPFYEKFGFKPRTYRLCRVKR